MARPVVGIYATIAPASWGPWVDRPSVTAPAALGDAVQRAGAMAVLLAPDDGDEPDELLRTVDALVVIADAEGADRVVAVAREAQLAVLVLDAVRAASPHDVARELAELLAR